MASKDGHRESSANLPETSFADEQVFVSMDAVSEQDAGSDGENPSKGFGDSENVSDSGRRVRIGAEATLAGMSYDFGQSTMTKAHLTSLKSFTRYFPKGFA
jgi:hypothetical protein